MSDLYNDFPSWGETGEYPQDGFFYEGGDQVNEKHMDALWYGVQQHVDNLNTAIRNRVRNLHGNVVLDQGLVASIGGGTREVDVTASNDGAYVSGQYTGSVSTQTTSHTANSGSSTRTDVVYLGQDGNVSKSEGTASAPADTLKIAEVDVATDDTISTVRNYARDHAHVIASENQPTGAEPGDLWQDSTANNEKVYQNGAWRKLLTEQDSATITAGDGLKNGGSFDLDGGSVTLDIEPADFAGSYLQDDGSDNLEVDTSSVATRSWVNSNADVPNADYADQAGDADTLDGNTASSLRPLSSDAIGSVNEYTVNTFIDASSGNSWYTLVDFSSGEKVYLCNIKGEYINGLRITFSDGQTLQVGDSVDDDTPPKIFGIDDAGGDQHSSINLPYIVGVTKIEVTTGEIDVGGNITAVILASG